jgi:hypothetical protein
MCHLKFFDFSKCNSCRFSHFKKVLSRFKRVNNSDNSSTIQQLQQKKNPSDPNKKFQLALPMLSLKTASKQLQKLSLASALQSKRKIDAKGIFSNVKSGKYHTNAAPQNVVCDDELAVTPSELITIFLAQVLHLIFSFNLTVLKYPAPLPQIQSGKEMENWKLSKQANSDFEDGQTASKGDEEGIYVTRASASYIQALREALGRKILFSAYPKSDGKRQGNDKAAYGVFEDVNRQFRIVTIDDVVFAECKCDDFVVRCSDNAAFSGSTGCFIGYWQNEGYLLTD